MSAPRRTPGISTRAIHGGGHRPGVGEPVVPPIVQSATFVGGRGDDELLYTRYGNNPLQRLVGAKIAELEGTAAGLVLGSGMGAIAMTLLALLDRGDHVLASAHLYGATRKLFEEELPRRGIATTFVDPEKGRGWKASARKSTRLIYFEAPTNPTLRIVDPRPLAELASTRGIPLVMDATFATPVNLRPAEHGVDVVMHSATKYLGGHSDIIAGAVAGSTELVDRITEMMRLYGPSPDPHMTWLLDRGLRTLDVRMERHNRNAMEIARFLESHDRVSRVMYPGLPSHPDHGVAGELFGTGQGSGGFGGMVSFVVKGGGKAADAVMDRLRVVHAATSLGGVESLMSQPRHTSHASLTGKARRELGIPDGFLRLSVGIEDAGDLIHDLNQALAGPR